MMFIGMGLFPINIDFTNFAKCFLDVFTFYHFSHLRIIFAYFTDVLFIDTFALFVKLVSMELRLCPPKTTCTPGFSNPPTALKGAYHITAYCYSWFPKCGKKQTIIPIWFNPMETNFTFKSWFNTAWFFNEKTLLDLNGQRSQLYLFKPSCECCLWTVKLPAKIISSIRELLLWWVKIS